MNIFEQHFKAIEDTYSSLEIFSDISWEVICNEYLASHESPPKDVDDFVAGFPQFLEDKAAEGECPTYLFEIAYVELMASILSLFFPFSLIDFEYTKIHSPFSMPLPTLPLSWCN